jgi:hypothetical protein
MQRLRNCWEVRKNGVLWKIPVVLKFLFPVPSCIGELA